MLDFKSTYVGLLNKCKKYPLYIGRIHMMMEMVFKILNNMYPRYLDKFVKFKNVDINLRILCNLSLPKFHTVCYGKNSFNYMAPFLWNQLENDCKKSASISIFKNCICNFIPICQYLQFANRTLYTFSYFSTLCVFYVYIMFSC